MVDDAEFMKRRHLSRGRPRKYEPSSSSTQQQGSGGTAPAGTTGSSPSREGEATADSTAVKRSKTPSRPPTSSPPGSYRTTQPSPLHPSVAPVNGAAVTQAAVVAAAHAHFKSAFGGGAPK